MTISRKIDSLGDYTTSIGILGDYAASINRDEEDVFSEERRTNLLFAAHFFDAYFRSHLIKIVNPSYLALLGAASFHLCDLPGNASLLTECIDDDCVNIEISGIIGISDSEPNGLEPLLLWLIRNNFYSRRISCAKSWGRFDEFIHQISEGMVQFVETGKGKKNLLEVAKNLRDTVYASGSPRELLLGDIIAATVKIHLSVVEKLDPAEAKKNDRQAITPTGQPLHTRSDNQYEATQRNSESQTKNVV